VEAKKALGQHFLVDRKVVADLVAAAEIGPNDTVLEVGAGEGILTKELAKKAGKVFAVEFDRDLIPALHANLAGAQNAEIVNADILKLDASYLLLATKIVGSIPYQITSPLLHKILALKPLPKSVALIVQKEVAEKIAAAPPKATYLSNLVALHYQAELKRTILPASFNPQPKVKSTILKLTLKEPPEETEAIETYGKFLHLGFASPRKMIHHRFPAEVLEKAGIPAHLRPAHLSKEDWRNLYRELVRTKEKSKTRRGAGTWRANY
jgi:16S rRNA (adenine1518-N6/adenine1519-N6)-dimethyltransferase